MDYERGIFTKATIPLIGKVKATFSWKFRETIFVENVTIQKFTGAYFISILDILVTSWKYNVHNRSTKKYFSITTTHDLTTQQLWW